MKIRKNGRSLLTTITVTLIPFYVISLFVILFFLEYNNISRHNRDVENYFKSLMENYSVSSINYIEKNDTSGILMILQNISKLQDFKFAYLLDSNFKIFNYLKVQNRESINFSMETAKKSLEQSLIIKEFDQNIFTDIYYTPIFTEKNGEKFPIGVLLVGVSRNENVKSIFKIIFQTLSITVVSLLLFFVVIWILYKRIKTPITMITKEMEQINQGKGNIENRKITVKAEKEVNDLIGEFNKVLDLLYITKNDVSLVTNQLNEHIELLSSSSEELTASSEEITSTIQEISQNSSEQAKKIEEVFNKTESTKNNIKTSFEKTKMNEEFSAKINQVTQTGKELSKKAVEKIETIINSSNELYEKIKDINEKQEKISLITDTIESITNRTNILSLNASIEAARAGEYGKGFQVVAEEIRKLAEKSQQSALSIHSIINEIKDSIEVLIVQSRENETVLSEGKEVVINTSEVLENISNSISSIAENSKSISEQIKNVKDVIDEFSLAIDEVVKISENNASASEEIAASIEQQGASIEELASSAQHLYEIVGKLKEVVDKFQR